nr:hypothetical protein GCM10020093_028270 [Planobispora longispora]
MSGRRPREVILMLKGGFSEVDRRALIMGVEGLRAVGYLIAVGEVGTAHVPLDLLTDVSPYLTVLSPSSSRGCPATSAAPRWASPWRPSPGTWAPTCSPPG